MNEQFNENARRSRLAMFHIDGPLLLGLLALMGFGLTILYSASGQNIAMMEAQLVRLGVALAVMTAIAQVKPQTLKRWSLPLFLAGLALLVAVLL
ncbi:MAG TPA: rod shape-determining protein RodA, partial [Rheinheimera sp.]|nr:rod shape-determining protein RodA [Rheinheimera sp.]